MGERVKFEGENGDTREGRDRGCGVGGMNELPLRERCRYNSVVTPRTLKVQLRYDSANAAGTTPL